MLLIMFVEVAFVREAAGLGIVVPVRHRRWPRLSGELRQYCHLLMAARRKSGFWDGREMWLCSGGLEL